MTDFVSFARAHGVSIEPSRLFASERIKRCGTVEKPKSTNGAYFWDGERGWVFNWATEARVQWFSDQAARPWTEAEKAAWKAKRQAAQQAQEQGYQRAAARAQAMLDAAQPAKHDYLHRKGFPDAQGLVAADGALLIPMRSMFTNALQGVQVIRWNDGERAFEKKMNPGMRAKGAVYRMGDQRAPEAILCEGYATGLSIHAALRSVGLRASVLVCFSANNLTHIAPLVRSRAFVFADHDKSGAGEAAAKATGLPYCMSDTVGFDANDDHQKHGLMSVCKKLMDLRRRRDL